VFGKKRRSVRDRLQEKIYANRKIAAQTSPVSALCDGFADGGKIAQPSVVPVTELTPLQRGGEYYAERRPVK